MNDLLVTLPVSLLWAAFTTLLVRGREGSEQRDLWLSFMAHQLCAVLLVVITVYYYGGGDLTAYFWSGKFISAKLRADFFDLAPTLFNVILQREVALPFPGTMAGTNTGSMQALAGFLCYFLQDSLYAVCMAIAGASFVAKVAVYDVFKQQLPDAPRAALRFGCLLVPSSVLWSAGLMKEAIAMLGVSAILWGGHTLIVRRRYSPLAMLAVGLGTLTTGLFKGYVLPVLGFAAGVWYLSRAVERRFGHSTVRIRYLIGAVALAAATLLATSVALPQFAPGMIEEESRNAQQIGARISGGSNYELGGASVGEKLPLAVATVFFRPMLFEANNPMIALNALEMAWITWLILVALFRRRLSGTISQVVTTPALAFCLAFVLIMAVGVGLTTTNLGTLSRYRMPLMVFYVVLLVSLAAKPKRAAVPQPTLRPLPHGAWPATDPAGRS